MAAYRSGEADRWTVLERVAYNGGRRKADVEYVADIMKQDWYVAHRILTMIAWGVIPTSQDEEAERAGRSLVTWREVVGCEGGAPCVAFEGAV